MSTYTQPVAYRAEIKDSHVKVLENEKLKLTNKGLKKAIDELMELYPEMDKALTIEKVKSTNEVEPSLQGKEVKLSVVHKREVAPRDIYAVKGDRTVWVVDPETMTIEDDKVVQASVPNKSWKKPREQIYDKNLEKWIPNPDFEKEQKENPASFNYRYDNDQKGWVLED
ncbi:MAG: hypothetical protein ABIC95_06040 [archaeon]